MIFTPADVAALTHQQENINPKTLVIAEGKNRPMFSEQPRTHDRLKKWWNVYESGGVYAHAIDTYAFAAFANGYRFEGKESYVQDVQDNFAGFDFDTIGMEGIKHSLIFGDGFQEIVESRGAPGIPVGIVSRDSSTFTIDSDDYGIISGYTQKLAERQPIHLNPKQIIHLSLIPSCGVYGISLIGRAYDDIMRDAKTVEASTAAIERHGFKKWHIKVGQPGEDVDDTILKNISTEFEDIESDNEFTTTADVNISALDDGGLDKIEEYSNISLMRVASSLGIPEEMLGLRRGSTDATAISRIETFLRTKISSIQRSVSRIYTLNYIDRIVPKGEVKLVFNDVREEDEFKKAEWIGRLISSISSSNPEVLPQVLDIFPKKWLQSQFNIPQSPAQES